MISVLCVDDDISAVEQIKTHLGRAGDILVEGCPSTLHALEMIKAHSYDAIIAIISTRPVETNRFLVQVRNRLGAVPVTLLVGKGVRAEVQRSFDSEPNVRTLAAPISAEDYDDLARLIRESVSLTKQSELVEFAEIASERMGIATIAIDKSGRIGKFNNEACRTLGYSDKELRAKSVWDVLAMLKKENWPAVWNQVRSAHQIALESEVLRSDGTVFPVDLMGRLEDLGGTEHLVLAFRDLTEAKAAETKLRETAESYRTLAQNLPGIVYRVKVREDNSITFFNDMLKPITGYDVKEDAMGSARSLEALIVEEDRADVRDAITRAVRSGEPFEVNYRLRAKDGSIKNLVERGRPLIGDDGLPIYVDGVIFDVTSQKMAEASGRELEMRLHRISGLLPAAVFEADPEGKVRFVNDATLAMSGYERDEVMEGPWCDLIAPEDRDMAMRLSARTKEEGTTTAAEVHLISKDGRRIPVSANWTRIVSEEGGSGVVGMMVDLSSSRRTEKIQNAINRIAQATIAEQSIDNLYRSIHKILGDLVRADNFYIAITSATKNELSFPYFVDARDPRPEPRKLGNGLTEYIISTGRPFLASGDEIAAMSAEGRFETVGSVPFSCVGVPLTTKSGVIGAMAMQSYDPRLSYGTQEIDILQFVSYQVAQAIESKRSEEEVQRSLSLLKGVFDSTADGLLVVDLEGRVLAMNGRFARMWSLPDSVAATMEDTHLLDFVQDQLKDPDAFMNRVRYLYDNPYDLDFDTIPFKDGRFFERYSQPYESDGRVVGRIWSFRDVTERRKAEEGLRQSETEMKAIINSAKDLIFVKDREGNYRLVNDAMTAFFGIPLDVFMGKSADQVFDAEFSGQILPSDREALAGMTVEREMYTTVGGVAKSLSVIKAPLRSPSGEIIGICGIARDMTERKKVEKALQEANASLDILNSITRHDVLNQLMVVRGYSDLVRSSLKDPKDLEHMDKIEKATRTIRSQILFTKDFQKLGSVEPKWQGVEELFDSAFSTLEMGPVEISVDVGGLEVYADPMLEKVFYNLIDNSLRHGEKVTRISVTCRKEKGGLDLTYEDDGIGINAADKGRIFDRAFGKNTGLGLFLTKAILGVTSVKIEETGEPGRGVRFEMHIPDGSFRFQDYARTR
ncbi:MAG TPA: PAS domain S-box protein [Methanomassiliicoccales archaeon]|nr:PAS domain S-box protein [Methanomassiliicoccales archaeon]